MPGQTTHDRVFDAHRIGRHNSPCSVRSVILELGSRHQFDVTTRALVMGILNRTPDSFYDQGSYFDFDHFLKKAEQLVDDGADILDVGGVKAGPGPEVTPEQEID